MEMVNGTGLLGRGVVIRYMIRFDTSPITGASGVHVFLVEERHIPPHLCKIFLLRSAYSKPGVSGVIAIATAAF